MEMGNNKIVFLAVLIMLLALVSFTVNEGGLAGRSVSSRSEATVYPQSQACSSYETSKKFTLMLDPGSEHIESNAKIVDSIRGYKAGELPLSADTFVESPLTKEFFVSCGDKGTYHLEFYNRRNELVVSSNSYSLN